MLEVILEYRDEAQNVFAWLVCLAALRWGGGPERVFSAVWLFTFMIVHQGYHAILDRPFLLDQMDVFHATLDAGAAFALILLALNANRFYTLWIAAFQVIAASAHLMRELVDAVTPIVYAIMVIAPSWFQLLIFAGGLLLHIKRKRRYGPYRDWRDPSWTLLTAIRSMLSMGKQEQRSN